MTRDLLYDEAHQQAVYHRPDQRRGYLLHSSLTTTSPWTRRANSTETYFLNMVDEADLLAAAEAAGVELAVVRLLGEMRGGGRQYRVRRVRCQHGTECAGVAPGACGDRGACGAEPETGGSMGTLLLILAVAGMGGGAAFYFKVIPAQTAAGRRARGGLRRGGLWGRRPALGRGRKQRGG